ncbi:MAG: phosphoglucosamine mutase, partial [Actinomycetota bacterium]|nr:phosphoglucosamine mutase [Actinomycetota bacterium]
GICAGGADALLAGVIPTPAVALLVRELGADGGVVISASHNPPEYNGIKFFSRDGFKLPDELEDEIERFTEAERDWERPTGRGVGVVRRIGDAVERYIAHCVQTIPVDLTGIKIAVDCGHGAATVATPEALERLGAHVVAINCEYSGMDINVGCGSTNLGPITELVRDLRADFGIAHDGDADRVLAVDENGDEVDGDVIMAITATHLKSQGKLPAGTVVSTVMANLGFDIAMRDAGINVIKTKVGDRYVLEQLQTSGAALGGEQSGHIIFLEHNTTGDGLVTALHLAAVMRQTGKPLSELRKVMRRYPQVLVNVPVADKARLVTSATLASAIREIEAELGDSGRVLVRASGTEPLVRVMAEASDAETAADVVDRLVEVVRAELG